MIKMHLTEATVLVVYTHYIKKEYFLNLTKFTSKIKKISKYSSIM